MKKMFCLMLTMASITLSFAQEVIVDSTHNGANLIVLGGNESTKLGAEPTCVYSYGTCMNFSKGIYTPAIGWAIGQCTFPDGTSITNESLLLITTGMDGYYSFDADSRVLIRFTDESTSILRRDPDEIVENAYDNMWMGSSLMHFYKSYVTLQLDSETRTKFFNHSLGVKKIRIVYANGDAIDYEMKGKRIMKFPEELRESFEEASQKNDIRTKNNDDSTF